MVTSSPVMAVTLPLFTMRTVRAMAFVRVVNHRAGLGAGHQAAVGLVGTVGKHLTGHPQPGRPGLRSAVAARKPQQDHVLCPPRQCPSAMPRPGASSCGHVAQGAVGLHVL